MIKAGSLEYIWLWGVALEPESKGILGFGISKEQNLLIAERSVSKLVNIYAQYPVSTYMDALVGIHLKHVSFWNYGITFILFMIKALLKGQSNTSRIEPNIALMTIFHAKERTVN